MGKKGAVVAEFERELAAYCGAKHAVAACNGTATLHMALVALGVKPGDRVAVSPLTMSSTTIALLHAGAVPVFVDVHPDTWLMKSYLGMPSQFIGVSLYGLHGDGWYSGGIDDAAQTLRRHNPLRDFTSLSFEGSKILSCGEGGALLTNSDDLALRAREFGSLGYKLSPTSSRIDSNVIRSPEYERHWTLGYNFRMSDLQAARLLTELGRADRLLELRRMAARMYQDVIAGVTWLVPQHVPDGWTHDYWTYAVAIGDREADLGNGTSMVGGVPWAIVADAIQRHGGERPYAAWQLPWNEPAFEAMYVCKQCGRARISGKAAGALSCTHWGPSGCSGTTYPMYGDCPVAESLQPRLMQFQTNSLEAAERNATALAKAIKEIGG